MKLSVSETARLFGISVRTLHYYDEIGLLKPSEVAETGYRFYDERNMERLQQILFFRELDFPLREIEYILSRPDFDRNEALQKHRALLLLKQRRIGDLIRLVDETIGGKKTMFPEKLTDDDYEEAKAKYAQEARARWGNTDAYRESDKRNSHRSEAETLAVMNEAGEIFAAFAACRGAPPSGPEAQKLVRRWQAHIAEHFYACTDDLLSCLGEMYTADARFRSNIDRYGAGTAQFISDAIRAYCGK
jgi:DNA-binding transcriptional MerR regulator